MEKVAILGSGSLGKQLQEESRSLTDHEFYLYDVIAQGDDSFLIEPVDKSSSKELHSDQFKIVIAIGDSKSREKLFNYLFKNGYEFFNLILSEIPGLTNIGKGNVIRKGVLIEPFVSIGDNNLISTGVYIGHDCTIGNHVRLSSRCCIAPKCNISDCSTVNFFENIQLGESR